MFGIRANLSEPPASAGGTGADQRTSRSEVKPPTDAGGSDLSAQFEELLIKKVRSAQTAGLKNTYYRAFVANASSENARKLLKEFPGSAGIPACNERVSTNGPAKFKLLKYERNSFALANVQVGNPRSRRSEACFRNLDKKVKNW